MLEKRLKKLLFIGTFISSQQSVQGYCDCNTHLPKAISIGLFIID